MRREGNGLRVGIFVSVASAIAPITGGLIVLIFDPNRPPEVFFEVCALLSPLFGLGLFVEIAVVMGQVIEDQGPTEGNRSLTRGLVRSNVVLLLSASGAPLWALVSGTHSAFLAVFAVVPLLLQILLLSETAYLRAGINRIRLG